MHPSRVPSRTSRCVPPSLRPGSRSRSRGDGPGTHLSRGVRMPMTLWDEVIAVARVLVIDDEDVIGAVLRYAFQEQGHETVTADGGRTGIEEARRQHPDAIVLDLMMPEV